MNEELREKVVKGLERCIEKLDTVTNKTHGFNCTACSYFKRCDSSGYLIGLPLMKDALALLKAQEPRLITNADFENKELVDSTGSMPAWIEYRHGKEWDEYNDGNDDGWSVVYQFNFESEFYRCWTSCPTEEQREAVKWE